MKIFICLFFLCMHSKASVAENITNKIIMAVIEKHTPKVLYEHVNKPWNMGIYSLRINKIDKMLLSSNDTDINLRLPIEAIIEGKIERNLFGKSLAMNCDTAVVTHGEVKIKPEESPTGFKVKVSILIPVPETLLNCHGVQFPIKPLLERFVSENKQKWERDFTSKINGLFESLGI